MKKIILTDPYNNNEDIIIEKINEIIDHLNERVTEEKEWKKGNWYYYIDTDGKISDAEYDDIYEFHNRELFMGVFRTREDALARLEQIKGLLIK